jgi:hypothetical protein
MTTLPDWFNDSQTERLLRENYQPILSADDYAKLRQKCGLGAVLGGDVGVDQPLPSAFTVIARATPPVVTARLNRDRPASILDGTTSWPAPAPEVFRPRSWPRKSCVVRTVQEVARVAGRRWLR